MTATDVNVDKLRAQELNVMSPAEREALDMEIHGVESRATVETPTMIDESLGRLYQELQQLLSHKPRLQPYLIHNPISQLGLRFLRADFFHVTKAATRFCKFLELLDDYFGQDVLKCGYVTINDLGRQELKLLKEGSIQILTSRDRFGRRIIAWMGEAGKEYSVATKIRLYLYVFLVVSEDVKTQQKGLVELIWPSGHLLQGIQDKEMTKESQRLNDGVPIRVSGFHLCLPSGNDFLNRVFKQLLLMMIGTELRRVARIHNGTLIECEYVLQSYGIKTDDIPLTYTGTVKTLSLQRWIRYREALESGQLIADLGRPPIECPEVSDVVFVQGRSKGIRNWGNVDFNNLVQSIVGLYCDPKTSTQERNQIVSDLIHQVHEVRKGRFLMRVEKSRGSSRNFSCWVELDVESSELRVKVRTAILTQKKSMEAHGNVTSEQIKLRSATPEFIGMADVGGIKRPRLGDFDSGSCFSSCGM
mmetsp:Transcript_20007/g.36122  ORF Transcript_20007/g.36122 Transcript_20007/m.36122 type:complete len:474 (-) Transcript_20007:61-1482(-)